MILRTACRKNQYRLLHWEHGRWGTGTAGGDQVFGNHYDEVTLKPVFEAAMREGLNLWDTAAVYGMGDSERILGKLIHHNVDNNVILFSENSLPQIAELCEDPVAKMLGSSLQRLGTKYIDIYWIHNPSDIEKRTPYLIPLAETGKIKRVGVSNHNLEQIKRVEDITTQNIILLFRLYKIILACCIVLQKKQEF